MRRKEIAYFSMEIGLDAGMPTYSGGLGVLAGDFLKAAADDALPVVGVTLLYRKGYVRQTLDSEGRQTESPQRWRPDRRLSPTVARAVVQIEGRDVHIRAWRRRIRGLGGGEVCVYFLDAGLRENLARDRSLTDSLYGGDLRSRLAQEALLGIGGPPILRALGHDVGTYHMNEGHAALLILALTEEERRRTRHRAGPFPRADCVFTNHTPVPDGHDRFTEDLVNQVLGVRQAKALSRLGVIEGGSLNMTTLALRGSRYANGVAMRHGQVSREMFPGYSIDAITNGVHATSWTSPAFRDLFDREIPGWRLDNSKLRHAVRLGVEDVSGAHRASKRALLEAVRERTGRSLPPTALTLGFARRATSYKRAGLLFRDPARLERIGREIGPLQVLMAGKAHPRDASGKKIIEEVFDVGKRLGRSVTVIYLEDYGMELAALLTAGVDVWLNTPRRPMEACGTSGMKAALNGVPSFSVLDGWWVEGHVEGVTGWSIGEGCGAADDDADADSLYWKLENVVAPLYADKRKLAAIRRSCIALNGSYFNAQRMVEQYARCAYGEPARRGG